MKIIAVYGSSRPGSLSAGLMDEILRGAADAGHEIVRLNINQLQFRGCIGCQGCKRAGSDCVLKDDLAPYFAQLHEAGALVLSAPNYMGQVSGNMVAFMNRHYCIGGGPAKASRLAPHTKLISVYAQGAPVELPDSEANYRWFHEVFLGMGFEDAGRFVVRGQAGANDAALRETAYQAGRAL